MTMFVGNDHSRQELGPERKSSDDTLKHDTLSVIILQTMVLKRKRGLKGERKKVPQRQAGGGREW